MTKYDASKLVDYPAYRLFGEADVRPADEHRAAAIAADVLYAVRDLIEHGDLDTDHPEDDVSALADSLVPVYTRQVWEEFTALSVWDEEGVFDIEHQEMTQAAQFALYQAYSRMVTAALEASETDDDDEH